MGIAEDAAALNGKTFASNYFYSVGTNVFSSGSSNGHPTYFGSVGNFMASQLSGTINVTDAANGVFTLGGQTYHLQGTDPTGGYTIFGNGASGGNPAFALSASGTTSTTDVRFSSDNTSSSACFAQGTVILTHDGEVPIEALRIGDLLVTSGGDLLPVRWLGYRRLDCRRHADPAAAWPFRVRAGAFGAGVPHSDLLLSKGHNLAIDCPAPAFIAVDRLENGATVAQERVDVITYWHVELDQHAVIFANGLPTESYLDVGNRSSFEDCASVVDLHPSFVAHEANEACLPFANAGPALSLARTALQDRAIELGWRTNEQASPRLLVDGVVIAGDIDDGVTSFRFPTTANQVWLLSSAAVPGVIDQLSRDERRLGVAISSVSVTDQTGITAAIPLDDDRLFAGFHEIETADDLEWRWTEGAAQLFPTLWSSAQGDVELAVTWHMTVGCWHEPANVDRTKPTRSSSGLATSGARERTGRGRHANSARTRRMLPQ